MRLPNVSTEQVPGRTLTAALDGGYLEGLFPTYVAESPDAALARVERRFGSYPSRDGNNVEGFVHIRDALYEVAPDARFAHATVIVTPHTHWSGRRPIVMRRHGEDYIVGPCDVRLADRYTPISFVFTSDGPLAFEWADGSISFEAAEIAEVYRVVDALSRRVAAEGYPLGLALNFRFKPLFSAVTIATVEFPLAGDPDESALIVPVERYEGPADASDIAQVAWHAYSDLLYGLDPDGLALLRQMRVRLSPVAAQP
jgi:hypothetical protein